MTSMLHSEFAELLGAIASRLTTDGTSSVFMDTLLNFIEVCMVSAEEAANRKRVKRALANHV